MTVDGADGSGGAPSEIDGNVADLLDRLEELVAPQAHEPEVVELLRRARERASTLAAAVEPSHAGAVAATAYLGDVLSALWLERAWSDAEIERAVDVLSPHFGGARDVAGVAVLLRALRTDDLLELPPRLAVETQLRLLRSFARVEEVSLWLPDGRRVECIVHLGSELPGRQSRVAARRALRSSKPDPPGIRSTFRAFPVMRWEAAQAALVIRLPPGPLVGPALALAGETASAVAQLLEVDGLLSRSAERERSLVESSERRLVRVGFDLHDGPMQDLVALAQDLDLFRAQLADVLEGDEHSAVMLGRVADVEARLRAVDRDLREIAQSLNAPAVLRTPLKDILTGEATSFSKRTGIEARVDVAGDLEGLTSSARIALLRLVQEALANVAHHSHAAHARVELAVARGHIRVAVEDDGDGFDVETALVHAARAGRLGLVGMGERIRLLGGHFDVRSAPGGPTAVTAMIPKWRPVERAGDE